MAIRSEYAADHIDFFDEHEDHRLLMDVSSIILEMCPFNWTEVVLKKQNPDDIAKIFLDSQEILLGKSFCDLHLRKPRLLHHLRQLPLYVPHRDQHLLVDDLAARWRT